MPLNPRLLFTAILFALGATVVGAAPAQRIISTSPSITQTIFALGLGDKLVGDTVYCDYPPEAKKKTRIGDFLHPNLESIIALHPDLVVVARTPTHISSELDRLGIKNIEVSAETFDGVFTTTQVIAQAAGVPEAAVRLNREMHHGLEQVRTKTSRAPRTTAAFVIERSPSQRQTLIVAGGQSYFTELLTIAGGQDVFADSTAAYSNISFEELLRRDPAAILEMIGPEPGKKENLFRLWQADQTLRAVRDHRVYAVPSELFVVPGPRMVDAARTLARVLHPELASELSQ